jgi:hypothetical protein
MKIKVFLRKYFKLLFSNQSQWRFLMRLILAAAAASILFFWLSKVFAIVGHK